MSGGGMATSTSTSSKDQEFTWKVREYAERERVSERTVRRWIEKGAVRVKRIGVGKLIRIIE